MTVVKKQKQGIVIVPGFKIIVNILDRQIYLNAVYKQHLFFPYAIQIENSICNTK